MILLIRKSLQKQG